MKKILALLLIISTLCFTGCTDYKAQVEELQTKVSELEETLEEKEKTITWLRNLSQERLNTINEKSAEIAELKARLSGIATSSNTQDSTSATVYVTKTGAKYHRLGCSYLKSCIPISLSKAIQQGYAPCSRCY